MTGSGAACRLCETLAAVTPKTWAAPAPRNARAQNFPEARGEPGAERRYRLVLQQRDGVNHRAIICGVASGAVKSIGLAQAQAAKHDRRAGNLRREQHASADCAHRAWLWAFRRGPRRGRPPSHWRPAGWVGTGAATPPTAWKTARGEGGPRMPTESRWPAVSEGTPAVERLS